MVAILLIFLLTFSYIISFNRFHKASPSDVIMVFGGYAGGNAVRTGTMLGNRLDEALRLYRLGYAPYIIVSGGTGEGQLYSEALLMRNYLMLHGVNETNIIMEDNSHSTWQNMLFSRPLLSRHNFNSVIAVSSNSHLARISLVAGRLNYPAMSFSGAAERRPFYLREVAAFLAYGLFYRE